MEKPPSLVTIRQAAQALGYTEGSLRDMIYKGRVKAVKVEWRTYLEAKEVERLLEKRKKVERFWPKSPEKPLKPQAPVDNSTIEPLALGENKVDESINPA